MRVVASFFCACLLLFAVDAIAWAMTSGPGASVALLPLLAGFGGACFVGLVTGLAAHALLRASGAAGPARRWTIALLVPPPSWLRGVLGLAAAVVVMALAVPLRARLLTKPNGAALLDLATVVAAFGVAALVIGVRPAGEVRARWWPAGRTRWWVAVLAGVVAVAGAVHRQDLLPSGLWDLWTIGSAVLLTVCFALLLPGDGASLSPVLHRSARLVIPAAAVLAAVALVLLQVDPAAREGVAENARPSSWLLALGSTIDLDDDGYSAFFGGGDCDDLDAMRSPDAPEVPGNGIDENCHGGDRVAPSPFPARPTFVDLPAGVRRPRHLVLITVDTLRADHMSAYGYDRPTTPNIDAWARDSWRYERSFSSAPYTLLAMPLIMTGRYLSRIPWNRDTNPWGLERGARTIARVLSEAGWATGGVASYRFFSDAVNWTDGFQQVDRSQVMRYQEEKIASTGPAVTRISLDWLRRHAGERGFLWLHYYDPHDRYIVHPDVPSFGDTKIDRYDGEIWWTDREIGKLLRGIEALGLADDTAVALVGDHGELFGEHGATFHGNAVWQELIHVPLILHVPGARPQVLRCPAAQIDLAPTLLNLAGIDGGREGMDGATLLADANGCDEHRQVLSELRYTSAHSFRVLLGDRYKLIQNVRTGTWQLFDLSKDPDETTNLRTTQPRVFARMQRQLLQWTEHTTSEEFARALRDVVVPRLPHRGFPVGARFDNGVELLAAELGDHQMTREKGLPIRLYWRLTHHLEPGCRVDLRFIDPAGNLVRDLRRRYVPFNGLIPFERVPPGRILRDARNQWLRGRRTGEFRVRVGLSCNDRGIPVSGGRLKIRGRFVELGKVRAHETVDFDARNAQ